MDANERWPARAFIVNNWGMEIYNQWQQKKKEPRRYYRAWFDIWGKYRSFKSSEWIGYPPPKISMLFKVRIFFLKLIFIPKYRRDTFFRKKYKPDNI